ncbi:MAG: hypothetical protein WAO98_09485 [Alphaproteobacteria bacterium]
MRSVVCGVFALCVALPAVAHAQASVNGQKFDQYPSFIETSMQTQDGTQVVLRCGYVQNGSNIVADPGFMETSTMNTNRNLYLRYQRIDNRILVTTPSSKIPGRFTVAVAEPNGIVLAKTCMFNGSNDTISACVAEQPIMTSAQMTSQDQLTASKCGEFLANAAPQLDRTTFNAQKTEAWKNALRQKVGMIESTRN